MFNHKIILCILDGWGHSSNYDANAIKMAHTPTWDRWLATYPHTLLAASGEAVGLPAGQMGNSEVGHTVMGAGRIPMQLFPRINQAIQNGTIGENPAFRSFINQIRSRNSNRCHVLGLVSPGGIHAHQSHLEAMLHLLDARDICTYVHGFTDGRDTSPQSGKDYFQKFMNNIRHLNRVKIATISGRYYAMDRDKNWERTQHAYNAIVKGTGMWSLDPLSAIQRSYDNGITDEFIKPVVVQQYTGMRDGDSLVMVNFRADRVRQLLSSLLMPNFYAFTRPEPINFAAVLAMANYQADLDPHMDVLFPAISMQENLGEILAKCRKRQLRVAETEKYAHVTFFFNSGQEQPVIGEDRIMIPSPKVSTYDLTPEMAAPEITTTTVAALKQQKYDFILVNFANADMVGHTGNLSATVQAIESIDRCLHQLEAAAVENNYCLVVTADHGNAEQMREAGSKQPYTAHTCNPVNLVMVNPPPQLDALNAGGLVDVAPTVLELMGLPASKFMSGNSLIHKTVSSAVINY